MFTKQSLRHILNSFGVFLDQSYNKEQLKGLFNDLSIDIFTQKRLIDGEETSLEFIRAENLLLLIKGGKLVEYKVTKLHFFEHNSVLDRIGFRFSQNMSDLSFYDFITLIKSAQISASRLFNPFLISHPPLILLEHGIEIEFLNEETGTISSFTRKFGVTEDTTVFQPIKLRFDSSNH